MKVFLSFVFIAFAASIAHSQVHGFFLEDAAPKALAIPESENVAKPSTNASISVLINVNESIAPVSKYIYGNNANIWMTQMVDQPVLLNHISNLSPNVIRFPGGTLSGLYFWDAEKNQPPVHAPAQIPDASGQLKPAGYWFGKNTESWTLSLDNYYQMLEQTNNTGMITVNYDYARYNTADNPVAAAAHYAADWVRYDNGKTKFWEIGNENHGTWQASYRIDQSKNKDGQPMLMSGGLYGAHFKIFADSMRKAAAEIGHQIYIGAQLLAETPANWWTDTERNWNTGVLSGTVNDPDFYIIHSYYTPYNTNSTAAEILASASKVTADMMEYLKNQMLQAGVEQKPVAMTEYNIFATGSKQQSSFINGMHTTMVLGEMIKHKYAMGSRWDLANGWEEGNDHGIFSQGDDGTTKWNPRAAFYYMYYFQKCFGDTMVHSQVTGNPLVLSYASSFSSGQTSVVLVNQSTSSETALIDIDGSGLGEKYYVYSLIGGSDNGEFSLKVSVNGRLASQSVGGPTSYKTIPARAYAIAGGIKVLLPPRSVQFVLIENGENVITSIGDRITSTLYPNPAREKLFIHSPDDGNVTVTIRDMAGRSVVSGCITTSEPISIEHLLPGVYIVEIGTGSAIDKQKIVIHR